MSYYVKNVEVNNTPINNFENSFTTEEAYDDTLRDIDSSVLSTTIQYKRDIRNEISKALLLAEEITDAQFESFILFIRQLLEVELICPGLLNEISVTTSEESELIFYRKTQSGVYFLSIDSDGDILLNFTGYKLGFETTRYNFGNEIDFENLVYHFLVR